MKMYSDEEEDIKILKQLIREYERKPKTQIEFFIKLYEERAIKNLLMVYEKQNQIIDLMANDLKTPVNSKEWIIEYYKKRCEDAKD